MIDDHDPLAPFIVDQADVGVVVVCLSAAIGLVGLLFVVLVR